MTPKVSLEYSSTAGRSQSGFGWTIPISKVSRSTKDGVPTYEDFGSIADTFVLELSGQAVELVRSDSLDTPFSTVQFRPVVESSYVKVGFDRQNNTWKVFDKDGTTYTFGADAAHRRGRSGRTQPEDTFSWQLQTVKDFNGNTITYNYKALTSGQPTELPEVILYGGNSVKQSKNLYAVMFDWAPVQYPANKVATFAAGFRDEAEFLLNAVETRAKWPGQGDDPNTWDLVRQYDVYRSTDASGIHRIDSVGLTGWGIDSGPVEAPQSVFTYSPSLIANFPTGASAWGAKAFKFDAPADEETVNDNGRIHDRVGVDRKARYDVMDIDGDAVVDRVSVHLDSNAALAFFVSKGELDGEGRPSFAPELKWDWPHEHIFAPAIRQAADEGSEVKLNIFDLTGDGRPDLVDTQGSDCDCPQDNWCVYEQNAAQNGFDVSPLCWATQGVKWLYDLSEDDIFQQTQVIDLTGDGRPDGIRLDGTCAPHACPPTAPVYFYHNTGSGFAPRVRIEMPDAVGRTNSGNRGTGRGYFDINGDGLSDFVIANDDSSSAQNVQTNANRLDSRKYWTVYFNQGTIKTSAGLVPSFSAAVHWGVETPSFQYGLPEHVASYTNSGHTTISELVDMTGDGLPDLVRRHTSESARPTASEIPYSCGSDAPPTIQDPGVFKASSGSCFNLLLFVNTGSSFAPPVAWKSPTQAIRADNGQCDFYEGFYPPMAECFDTLDFDGDGLLDLLVNRVDEWGLLRNPAAPETIAPGDSGEIGSGTKPNLMVAMMNGLGAESYFFYTPASRTNNRLPFPYWLVEEIDHVDRFSGVERRTTFAYENGRYSGADREFRGFGRVWAIDGAGRGRVSDYNQDKRRKGTPAAVTSLGSPYAFGCTPAQVSSNTYTTHVCNPWNYALSTEVSDWGQPDDDDAIETALVLNGTVKTPYNQPQAGTCSAPLIDEHEPSCATARVASGQVKTIALDYDGYGNERLRTVSAPNGSNVTTETQFDTATWNDSGSTSSIPASYLVSRPKSIVTTDNDAAKRVYEQRFEYWPSSGLVSKAETCQTRQSDGEACSLFGWSTTHYTKYDEWGNLRQEVSPINGIIRTGYGREKIFPVMRDDVRAHTRITAAHDPGTGQRVIVQDSNELRRTTMIDGLGRIMATFWSTEEEEMAESAMTYVEPCVADPLDPGSCEGAGSRPGSVKREVWATQSEYATAPTTVFYDGSGRVLGIKSETSAAGNPVLLSGAQRFDPETGEVTDASLPFVPANQDVDSMDLDPDLTEASQHQGVAAFERDFAGRVVSRQEPSGATTTYKVGTPGVIVTSDANLNAGQQGAATIDLFDAMGRKTETQTCSQTPSSFPYDTCDSGTLLTRTEFAYDALDRPVSTTQYELENGANLPLQISYTEYDGLGKPVYREDADTGDTNGSAPGHWSYEYDKAGNQTLIVRPNEAYVRKAYDFSGRLKSIESYKPGTAQQPEAAVSVTYGRKAKNGNFPVGRPLQVSVRNYSTAVDPYVALTRAFTYNQHGSVTSTDEIVDSSLGVGDVTRLKTRYFYDGAQRLIATDYPKYVAGDLEYERVNVEWNEFGQRTGLWSTTRDYVKNVEYDIYGNAIHLRYGNDVHDFLHFEGAQKNLRLRCARTLFSDAASPNGGCDQASLYSSDLQAVRYDVYDANGRFVNLADARFNGVANLSASRTADYDSLGRLEGVAYGDGRIESFTYDSIGNMTVRGRQNGGSSPVITEYDFDGSNRPHQPAAFGADALEYDPNGNIRKRGATTYTYDSLDRLYEVKQGSTRLEQNGYDESGSRIYRYSPTSTSEGVRHYLAGGLFEVNGSQLTRHFFLGSVRIAVETSPVPSDLATDTKDPRTLFAIGSTEPLPPSPFVGRQAASRAARLGDAVGTFVGIVLVVLGVLGSAFAGERFRRIATATMAAFILTLVPGPSLSLFKSRSLQLGVQTAEAAQPNELRYFHVDYLGSPSVVTQGSTGASVSVGGAVERLFYYAYGDIRSKFDGNGVVEANVVSPRGFTGYERGLFSNLLYAGARHYDPDTALFLTSDPKAQFASPYLYAGGNPMGGTDPDGQWLQTLFALAALLTSVASIVVSAVAPTSSAGLILGYVSLAFSAASFNPQGAVTIAQAAIRVTTQVLNLANSVYGVVRSAMSGEVGLAIFSGVMLVAGYVSSRVSAGAGSPAEGGAQAEPSGLTQSAAGNSRSETYNTVIDDLDSEGIDYGAMSFREGWGANRDGHVGRTKVFSTVEARSEAIQTLGASGQNWLPAAGYTYADGRSEIFNGAATGGVRLDLPEFGIRGFTLSSRENMRLTIMHEVGHQHVGSSEFSAQRYMLNNGGLRGVGGVLW